MRGARGMRVRAKVFKRCAAEQRWSLCFRLRVSKEEATDKHNCGVLDPRLHHLKVVNHDLGSQTRKCPFPETADSPQCGPSEKGFRPLLLV